MIELPFNINRVAGLMLGSVLVAPAEAQRKPSPDDRLAGFDAYVEHAMREYRVPGVAIAAVRGDSVVLLRGYGVRTVGDSGQVDGNTLFAIGSATKAFTGAAMAMLVDSGNVILDNRVTDYLPGFQLQDPWVSRDYRVRDLFLHRSGIARGDNLFYGTTRSREDIVRAMRELPSIAPFRTRFQYHNLTFIAAGEVIHQVSGLTYDDFILQRILRPLGMTRSSVSVRGLDGQPNVATPHADLDGKIVPVAYRNIDNAAASGGVNSTAAEMTRWLRLWLGRGTFEGRRLLSERMVMEATRPRMTVDDPDMIARFMTPPFLGYGLGWFIFAQGSRQVVSHGGRIDGMSAMVGFLPEERIGVVILTNLNQTDIDFPLMSHLLDRLQGVTPPRDWVAEHLALQARYAAGAPTRGTPARVEGTRPSLPLSAYAGTYRHAYLGTITVAPGPDGGLTFQQDQAPTAGGPLEHWHYDSFVARLRDPIFGSARVTFRLNADGRVEALAYSITGADEWIRVQTSP